MTSNPARYQSIVREILFRELRDLETDQFNLPSDAPSDAAKALASNIADLRAIIDNLPPVIGTIEPSLSERQAAAIMKPRSGSVAGEASETLFNSSGPPARKWDENLKRFRDLTSDEVANWKTDDLNELVLLSLAKIASYKSGGEITTDAERDRYEIIQEARGTLQALSARGIVIPNLTEEKDE